MPNRAPKKQKDAASDSLPTIECSCCGAKILLVPNVKKMSEAIEAHAQQHAASYKTKKEKDAEAERVRGDLISKVLSRACEA